MYRDALPTLQQRWQRLGAEVREGVGRIEASGWRHLPAEARERIEGLLREGERWVDEWHHALAAIDALERCRVSVDDALAAMDDPHHAWNVPAAGWPGVEFPWMRAIDASLAEASSAELGDEAQERLSARVRDIARRFDGDATLDAAHGRGARARFRVGGAPMVFDVWAVRGSGFWSGPRVEVGLLTTARRSAPRLVLRPEGASGGLGRSGRGAATGDAELDGRFVWEGEPGATAALRAREVQKGLREVCMEDVPTLAVAEGVASMRWTFAPTVRSVTAAVAVLRLLRGG